MKYIIEGIDRLGKSTLINNIIRHHNSCAVDFHLDKPQILPEYLALANGDKNEALKMYQIEVYVKMFRNLKVPTNDAIIYDRGHLGECVYAPLYRKYSGSYVFELEKTIVDEDVKLILLTTDNFDFIEDDGDSFDFSKKEEEQDMFIAAWGLSKIKDKCIINVHNGKGGYRSQEEILAEALKSSVQSKETVL